MKLIPPQVLGPVMGTQVSFADFVQLTSFVTAAGGIGLALQQGVTDALPVLQPVELSFPGGLVVKIGGPNINNPQWALCQGLLCASVGSPPGTQVQFNVPVNAGSSVRTDAIVCQPVTVQVGTVNRPVEQPGGSKPTQAVPMVINGLAFQYVEGPNGGGNPTIPTGWENFCYITVAIGASSLTDDDISINFPYMNPNSFTLSTTPTTVPAEGSNVTINVNDISVWDIGDFGCIIGPHADNAFMFVIVDIDENQNTLTVTNLNTTINGTGTIADGAFVLPAGDAPVICSTSNTVVPALGSVVNVYMSSTGAFTQGAYGLMIGPGANHGFYFVVVQNFGKYCQVRNIGVAIGGSACIGASLTEGSTIYPSNPPAIVEEDQGNGGALNPTQPVRVKFGVVVFTGAGSQAVTFDPNMPFSGNSTYHIGFSSNTAGMSPIFSAKTAAGFMITASAAGSVTWEAIGY